MMNLNGKTMFVRMVVEKPSQAPATPKPAPPQPKPANVAPSARMKQIQALSQRVAAILNQIKNK